MLDSWVFREWVSPTIVGLWTGLFVQGVRWVEHDPSGVKRYYGTDPFTGVEAKIRNELGEAEWLLVREEDQFGNAITYEYHHADDQNRSDALLARAQQLPVLKRVAWGQNRLTGIGEQFWVETSVSSMDGPIDMLNGHTILTSQITSIKVGRVIGGPVGETYWDYKLNHEPSPTTGRQRLASVERIDHSATSPTYRKTSFSYGDKDRQRTEIGGAVFAEDWQDLSDPLSDGPHPFVATSMNSPLLGAARATLDGAANAIGFRSATKFLDFDGDGYSDALYHGAGLGVPEAQIVGMYSRLGCESRGTCATGATAGFDTKCFSELADLDGDGDVDPLSFGEQINICSLKGYARNPASWDNLRDALSRSPKIWSNPARESGVQLPGEQFLPYWPTGATRVATITMGANPHPYQKDIFNATTVSDFTAPIVDLNGDGRPEISLLKTYDYTAYAKYANENGDHCDPADGLTTRTLFVDTGHGPEPVSVTIPVDIAERLDELPRRRAPRPMRALLRAKLPPTLVRQASRLRIYSNVPAELSERIVIEGIGDLSGLLGGQMYAMGGFGGGRPGGEIGMPNPEGDSGFPKGIPGWFTGRGWEFPWQTGGQGGPGSNCVEPESFPATHQFVPHTYVATGDAAISYEMDASGRTSGFTQSLQRATGTIPQASVTRIPCAVSPTGSLIYCGICAPRPAYPTQVSFNSIFLDVNSDSLPDLVLAEPPAEYGTDTVCMPGHRVLINRGYRFEYRDPEAGPMGFEGQVNTEEWVDSPFPAEGWSKPLRTIQNRGGMCMGADGTKFNDATLGGDLFAAKDYRPAQWGIPIGAMSPVDIDADGRVDIVTAYDELTIPQGLAVLAGGARSDVRRRIFRNTGRGFQELPTWRVNQILPRDFVLADVIPAPDGGATGNPFEVARAPATPNAGRFVDFDHDGLTDIVKPGVTVCSFVNDWRKEFKSCTTKPAQWIRNTGALPDVLVGVDDSLGNFTEVTYESALGDSVTLPSNGIRPPRSMRVATKIVTGTVPTTEFLAGAPPPQEVTLEYENFVRDPVSREQVGFEKVTAHFQNAFGGEDLEVVSVEQRYDVRAEIEGIALRHPLKGALVESVTRSSDSADKFTTTYLYNVGSLGDGVRIRSDATFMRHCICLDERETKGSEVTECRATANEVTKFDSLGYAKKSRQGLVDGEHVLDGDSVETEVAYEHRDGSWILGLATNVKTRGTHINITGQRTPDTVLSEIERTFSTEGLIETVERPSFQAVGCEMAGMSDLTRHEYTAEGLLERTTTPRGQISTTIYAADRLYAESKYTEVDRYLDGENSGETTYLESFYGFDRRTGAPVRITDPNGTERVIMNDSFGRELWVSFRDAPGAPASLLRKSAYSESGAGQGYIPPTAETATYRDVGVRMEYRTYLDGVGNVLGVVEAADGEYTRRGHAKYDAFGRVVLKALPVGVSSISDYEVLEDLRFVEIVTDGFSRVREVTKPNGSTTSFDHGPGWAEETNARGYVTHRKFDWRGRVVSVERRGDGNVSATHVIERDGLGRLAAVKDADETVRRFERDLGGRLRFASSPHDVDASPLNFEYCHDAEDAVVSTKSPAGRHTAVSMDGLGRVVSTTSELQDGEDVTSFRSYDDPTTPYGIGRLTRVVDDAGVTATEYDAFGRASRVERVLPGALFGGSNEPVELMATFDYDFAGNLTGVSLLSSQGPLGDGRLSIAYERDSRGRATELTSGRGAEAIELVGVIEFDSSNRLVAAKFGNGVDAMWDYNATSQHLNSITYAHTDSVIAEVVYPENEYDLMGNLGREQRFDEDGELLSDKVHTYDALDRLDSSSLWHPLDNKAERFTYSPAGNIDAAGEDAYEYERADLPQSATAVATDAGSLRELAYDDDGNLVSDIWSPSDEASYEVQAQERRFTWNAAGCLTSVTADNGDALQARTEFTCNSAGQAIARRTTEFGAPVSSRIGIMGLGELLPDEGVFLLRIPVGGTVHVEESWTLGTGERAPERSGYVLNDARGSVLAKTSYGSEAPTVDQEAEYDAWGGTARISELSAPQFRFTGEEPDPVTGIYHFGVRAYDPSLRRWLSPDPLFLLSPESDAAGGELLNLYAYSANNPVMFVDPLGLAPNQVEATDPATIRDMIEAIEKTGKSGDDAMEEFSENYTEDSSERYFYTEKYGWVDGRHFGGAADKANDWDSSAAAEFAGAILEAFQWIAEWGDDYRSGFSPEDVPSNAAGAEFGDDYLDEYDSAAEAFEQWAKDSGALPKDDPKAGYSSLPPLDPSVRGGEGRGSSNFSSEPPERN